MTSYRITYSDDSSRQIAAGSVDEARKAAEALDARSHSTAGSIIAIAEVAADEPCFGYFV